MKWPALFVPAPEVFEQNFQVAPRAWKTIEEQVSIDGQRVILLEGGTLPSADHSVKRAGDSFQQEV